MKNNIKKFIKKQWIEWRFVILITVFVILPLKSSIADWSLVPTGSMNPTILEGDLILVNKLAYDLKIPLTLHHITKWANPTKGEIVACKAPDDGRRLVKRIIGVPGDEIEMKSNVLFINGNQIKYYLLSSVNIKYLSEELIQKSIFAKENLGGIKHLVMSIPSKYALRSFQKIIVPEGKYFVMGDNRDNSKDSRFFGFVDRKMIFGRVKKVILSFNILDKFQPRFRRFFYSLD